MQGKISLVSSEGTQQLQILIIVLAVFHILSSLVTLLLGEAKVLSMYKFVYRLSAVEMPFVKNFSKSSRFDE